MNNIFNKALNNDLLDLEELENDSNNNENYEPWHTE